MKLLNHHQIQQKIKRLAFEILENNYDEEEVILAGINNNGLSFARLLLDQLKGISDVYFSLTRIELNPADPLSADIRIDLAPDAIAGKSIIIVDDVANTGRTIFYACKPLMTTLPKKIEMAVLVDRQHKSFPVQVDYVGLSLATTLMEDIDVRIRDVEEHAVFLN